MLPGVFHIAAALPEFPSLRSICLWSLAIIVPLACTLLFARFIVKTKTSWGPPNENGPFRSIARERAEKACDTVLSVCAFLIPATLGLITWLNDKVGPGSYIIPLGFALLYFFALLIFTTHLRFNFFWGLGQDFLVSTRPNLNRNLRFAYWLTTATTAIVFGLVLLSVPVLELGLGWLKLKPTPPPDTVPVKVEVTCEAPGPPLPPPPPPPCKGQKHRHRSHPPCPCSK